MKKLHMLGLLAAGAVFAWQPASSFAAETGFDGNYAGAMTLSPSGLSTDNAYRSKCVSARPATMTIRNGGVIIEYANYRGHKLHYRGRVDGTGAVTTYHRNGDGTMAQLNGRISNNVLSGNMMREGCAYTVSLARR